MFSPFPFPGRVRLTIPTSHPAVIVLCWRGDAVTFLAVRFECCHCVFCLSDWFFDWLLASTDCPTQPCCCLFLCFFFFLDSVSSSFFWLDPESNRRTLPGTAVNCSKKLCFVYFLVFASLDLLFKLGYPLFLCVG